MGCGGSGKGQTGSILGDIQQNSVRVSKKKHRDKSTPAECWRTHKTSVCSQRASSKRDAAVSLVHSALTEAFMRADSQILISRSAFNLSPAGACTAELLTPLISFLFN